MNVASRVTLLLLTYEDGERNTAEPVLRAALDNLRYDGPLTVHIADDGSIEGHVERLRHIAGGYAHVVAVGSTNAGRRGYGHSYNLATQEVHLANDEGMVLPLEDDWLLQRPLALDPLVATLSGHYGPHRDNSGAGGGNSLGPFIDCIRLGYIGFTQRLAGAEFVHTPAGPMVTFDPASPEPHVFAGHPRLETVAFERRVGPWPEGLQAGATEFSVGQRREAREGIAWPLDYGPASQRGDSLFVHIGGHELGEVEPTG